jgi:hypothetical protein
MILEWPNFVRFVHGIFVLFILLAPFSNVELLLTYHFIIVPFLWMHWYTNNDVCALTLIESKLRGIENTSETYLGSIINPIYQIQNKDMYIITGILFLITTYNLHYTYNFNLLKQSYHQVLFLLSYLRGTIAH